jgi:hypothetical protein
MIALNFNLPPWRGKVDRASWRETEEGAISTRSSARPLSRRVPRHPLPQGERVDY